MIKKRWREFVPLIIILAVLTALALVGMLQIFNAADETRHSVRVAQCQNIVLGDAIHKFHLGIVMFENVDRNDVLRKKQLLKDAEKEPDIALTMAACEKNTNAYKEVKR